MDRRKNAIPPPPGLGFAFNTPQTAAVSPAQDSSAENKPRRRPRGQRRPAASAPANGAATEPTPPIATAEKTPARQNRGKKPQQPKNAAAKFYASGSSSSRPSSKPSRDGGGGGGGTSRTSKTRRPREDAAIAWEEHWDPETVAACMERGTLFAARFRCNPADRAQGFCTVPGLPHDVFIPGVKFQNRAIEGDEVAIKILAPSRWHEKRGSRGQGGGRETRHGVLATPGGPSSGKPLPFTPQGAAEGRADAIACPSEAAAEGEEAEEEEEDELVVAPALIPSPSGGELPVTSMEEDAGEGEEEEDSGGLDENADLGYVAFLSKQLQQTAISTPPQATSSTAAAQAAEAAPWASAASKEEAVAAIMALLQGGMEGWRPTGEVVAVVAPSPRRRSVVGVLRMYGRHLSLMPKDARLPRATVKPSAVPPALREALLEEAARPDGAPRSLVVAEFTRWESGGAGPAAAVTGLVGKAGELQPEVAALLAQEGVHDDDKFTPEVLACLPPTPWAAGPADVAARRDLRSWRIFSIDPPTARDLDDALSVEELPGSGLLRIGVHIADVSHFVRPSTALDAEAKQRSTSTYLVDRVIPMLPRLLCEELCSLNAGVDRLAFSIVWEMTKEGRIQSTWFGRSIINSCAKLSYPQVQAIIEASARGEDPTAAQQPLPEITLHGGHTWPQVANDALQLHAVASSMRHRRFAEDGALRLDNARLFFELDEEGKPAGYGVYQRQDANSLVEEFMLAANMSAARIIAEAFPDRALLRRHPPPNASKVMEMAGTVARLLPAAPPLDVSCAGALQATLSALRSSVPSEIADAVTLLCTRPMQNAQYFCTGDEPEPCDWRHYALAVGHYTHFTSPIRRYPDVVVHRLLAAALEQQGLGEEGAIAVLAPGDEISFVSEHANQRKTAAKAVQDGALKLYLASLLLRRPGAYRGVIVGLGGSAFFDVFVPSLGIEVRVHVERMLAGGGPAMAATWTAEEMKLELQPVDSATLRKKLSAEFLLPKYDDVENFDALVNCDGVQPLNMPLELRPLLAVPLIIAGSRSKLSGSPSGVHAKLWVQ